MDVLKQTIGILEEIMPEEDLLNKELALIKGGNGPIKPPTGCANGSGCTNGSGCANGVNYVIDVW